MPSPRRSRAVLGASLSLLAIVACDDDEPRPRDAAVTLDAAVDTAPPLLPPFDWVGVVGTGQSLSIGATSTAITKAQPFHNLRLVDTGADPKYPLTDTGTAQWAAVPLVEPARTRVTGTGAGYADGQYPNNINGETPHAAMANALTALFAARGGTAEYVTAHSPVGWSGHCLVDIDKAGGKRAYPASLHEAAIFKSLANAAGKTFGYGGMILTHGECDGNNANYGAGLYALWQAYNTDLKAITGQSRDVVLFASQQSTISPGNRNNSAVQLWRAGVEHPGQIICIGPKYQYGYSSDNLHFQAAGYIRLGEKHAEVFDLVVNQGRAWKPLQPSAIARDGAKLTITFDVPDPPLAWDDHVAPPHQTANTAWAKGRGFEVLDAANAPLEIADAAIKDNTVVLTLAAVPTGALTVSYAITQDGTGLQGGTALGMYGQLRDSDAFIAYDAETITANVTNGSAVVTSATSGAFARRAPRDVVTHADGLATDNIIQAIASTSQLTLSAPWTGATGTAELAIHHDLRNYAVHFSMPVP